MREKRMGLMFVGALIFVFGETLLGGCSSPPTDTTADHPLAAEAAKVGVEIKSSALTMSECIAGGNVALRCPVFGADCNYSDTAGAGETLVLVEVDNDPFKLVCKKLASYPRIGDPSLYPDLGSLYGANTTPGSNNVIMWIKQGTNQHAELAANVNPGGINTWNPSPNPPGACMLPPYAVPGWTRVSGEYVNGTYFGPDMCQAQGFTKGAPGVTSLYYFRF